MKKPLNIWLPDLFEQKSGVRVLFRVDAGRLPGLSFGHLSRCALMMSVLKETLGGEYFFLMRSDCRETERGAKIARKMALNVLPLQGNEAESVIYHFQETKAHWLISDLPYPEQETAYFATLRKAGGRILFIDDARYMEPDADAILNSGVQAPERYFTNNNVRMLLGLDYFLFRKTYSERICWGNGKAPRVLFTFGGSDPTGLTIRILETLHELRGRISPLVILGPGFHEIDKARRVAPAVGADLIHAPKEIEPYFYGADLVVCAGGRTMYELYMLGVKFLPIGSTKHEAEAVDAFLKRRLMPSGLPEWDRERFITILKQRTGIS